MFCLVVAPCGIQEVKKEGEKSNFTFTSNLISTVLYLSCHDILSLSFLFLDLDHLFSQIGLLYGLVHDEL